ncbi:MAG: hypothetical protein KAS32_07205 [Candidatus Peribacteraceae bacterium]|nr:hypothetical protein [Candidatus Peribacteraceae bacterium]
MFYHKRTKEEAKKIQGHDRQTKLLVSEASLTDKQEIQAAKNRAKTDNILFEKRLKAELFWE